MKYLLLPFSFVMACSVSAQVPGLVSWWKMDGGCVLSDATDSPADGVLMDVLAADNRTGAANTALSFYSNTSYITLGAIPKLKLPGDKTISFWIKPVLTGSNRTGSVFSYGSAILVRYEEQGSQARLNIIFGNSPYMQVDLLPDQWQSITVTFKQDFSITKSKAYCYVNGILVSESEVNKSTHDFSNAIVILGAAGQNTLTNGFRGSLDDLRIYNHALSGDDVQNLVLPAKLEFFRGEKSNGSVALSWKTLLEESLSHFNLQRSEDGIHFRNISRVDAGKYSYLIYDLPVTAAPLAWYRLQMVDQDGASSFSQVIRVSLEDTAEVPPSAPKIFPNPGTRRISFTGISSDGNVAIVNSSGMLVKRQQVVAGNAVDISDLPRGLYYLVLSDGKRKTTSKFIKQ